MHAFVFGVFLLFFFLFCARCSFFVAVKSYVMNHGAHNIMVSCYKSSFVVVNMIYSRTSLSRVDIL